MPRVLLARHGETEYEQNGRLLGRLDEDLSAVGVEQAVALEERLADLDVNVVVTSPLRRARHTADLLVRALGLDATILPAVTDLDFGRWTGHTTDELMREDPVLFETWLDRPAEARFPDGESLDELRERLTAGLHELLDAYPEEANILVVTHEHPARSLLTLLLGLAADRHWDIAVDPGSLSVFERRGTAFYLTLLNETCHLEHVGRPHLFRP